MSMPDNYQPGAAAGAEIQKDGDNWTLVLVRDLAHPPARVWKALTEPEHLREWAPFDADRNLASVGAAKLTTVGAPKLHVTDTQVKRAEAEKALEFNWGGGDLRWELAPTVSGGTKLTLWAIINRNYIAMGAAGWHICFDVLDRLLEGKPMGRIVGPVAMQLGSWEQLHGDYQKLLGVATPKWS
jgi:uncharacterized protein YndB with AHSA1/START domain